MSMAQRVVARFKAAAKRTERWESGDGKEWISVTQENPRKLTIQGTPSKDSAVPQNKRPLYTWAGLFDGLFNGVRDKLKTDRIGFTRYPERVKGGLSIQTIGFKADAEVDPDGKVSADAVFKAVAKAAQGVGWKRK